VFHHDVATHLRETVKGARALSMADIVAPAFAGPVLDPDLLSIVRGESGVDGVHAIDGKPQHVPRSWPVPGRGRRILANLEALAHPFDSSARILVLGLAGFLTMLALETAVTMLAAGVSLTDALYTVAKVTVTVGPSQYADDGETWFKLFSAAAMLLTLGFAAVLTAGLVNRLLDARLTGIVGRKAVPRRGHVVVVGLGQVGFRLAILLREIGIPAVVIEQNANAKNVTRAKDERLPVVIGSGASQAVLRRLSIDRARGVAAVTSDEVENIAVAVAARGVRGDLNITLRAGDGDEASEIEALFDLGVVRDIYRIAGSTLAAVALGFDVHAGFPYEGTLYLVDPQGEIHPFAPGGRREVAGAR
jgi:voltage-gated potassium channel Kch